MYISELLGPTKHEMHAVGGGGGGLHLQQEKLNLLKVIDSLSSGAV